MSALLWFVNTRLGQTLILAAGVLLAAGLAYHWAYHRGELACDARHLAATLAAQTRQQSTERAATQTAETIADTTRQAASTSRAQNATQTAQAVQRVHHAQTTSIVVGCTVPDRVRDEGRAAVERARSAARGLPATP